MDASKNVAQKKYYQDHKKVQGEIRNINYHIQTKGLSREEIKAYYKEHGYDKVLTYIQLKDAEKKVQRLSKII